MITSLLIALGLSMDSFAVSLSIGGNSGRPSLSNAIKTGFFFGSFQTLMPLIGWIAGTNLHRFIAGIDHWVAFGLLSGIGCKMIYQSIENKTKEQKLNLTSTHLLLLLSLVTSIDALVVGISFAFIKVEIITQVLVIGIITFIVSLIGVIVGNKVGNVLKNRIGIIGGLMLIVIGTKILFEHLL